MYYTYMIRVEGGALYTGIAKDPFRRMREHMGRGKACARYTRSRRITALEALWSSADRASASRLEYALKTLAKPQKEALIRTPALLSALLPRIEKEDFVFHPKACLALFLGETDLTRLP